MPKSRIGEAYLQIVPVIGDLSKQLSTQLNVAATSSEATNAASDAGENLGNEAGESAGSSGGKKLAAGIMAGLAAAGIADFLKDSISEGLEQQTINNQVAAGLGLNQKQQKVVSSSIADAYKQGYGESYDEVADGTKGIVSLLQQTNTKYSSKQLTEYTEAMQNLSSAGLDQEDVLKAVQTELTSGFAPNFKSALGIVAEGYQKLGPNADDFLDTLNEYSGDFKEFGLNGQQALNFISDGMKAGAKNTDTLGDALNEVKIRLTEKSDDQYYQAIGLDPNTLRKQLAAGGKEATAALQEIIKALQKQGNAADWANIFGTQAEDFKDVFSKINLDNLTDSSNDANKSLSKLNKTVNGGVNSSLTGLKRTITQTFIDLLMPALNKIAPVITAFAGWLEKNKVAATAIAAVLGGVLLASLYLVIAALWAANAAMLANPMTWIILAIIAAVALLTVGIYELVKHWDTVMGALATAAKAVADFFISIWNAVATFFIAIWNDVAGFFVKLWNSIANFFIGIWNGILKFFEGVGQFFINIFNYWLTANIIVWTSIIGFIQKVWSNVIGWVSGVWNGFWNGLINGIKAIGTWFTNLGKGIVNFFIGIVNNVINLINTIINAVDKIKITAPKWAGGWTLGFNIPNIPNIPQLANGGTVLPTPGGTLVNVAERGKPETIVDSGKMNKLIDQLTKEGMSRAAIQYIINQAPGEPIESLIARINQYNKLHGLVSTTIDYAS